MKRENLINYFIKESKEDHDCEVVAYGLDVIGSGIITFMVLMTIGWISHCLKETLVYIICHLLVARSTGGYHAATRLRCLGLTTTMCILIICITDHIWSRISIWGVCISWLFFMFLIWKSAPVEHPHKKLDELTMKTNRKKSFVYTLTMFVVIMIFWNIDRRVACALWLNITEIIILMLVGKEVYRHDERKGFEVID